MSKYVVKSDRAQTVPGLGVFQKDEEREFTEQDAEGFIKLFGLPMKVQAMLDIEGVRRGRHEEPDYSKYKRD